MLTDHIELPPLSRLPYARRMIGPPSGWALALYPGNKVLSLYQTEDECRAACAELKVRIAVAKALGC